MRAFRKTCRRRGRTSSHPWIWIYSEPQRLSSIRWFHKGEDHKPPGGSIIVMDCRSGEILALVSRPAFGPGAFARGLTSEEWERIRSGRHPLFNRAIQSRYPPGSVFKTVTGILALEAGIANRGTVFSPCYGSYRLGNRTFRCWKKEGHGHLAFVQGMAQSCDVYYYQLGRSLGFQRLTEGSRALGIDVETGIDLPQEGKGWIPESEDYVRMYGYPPGPGVPLNLAIGQGELLFTPIELAVLYAAVANGGEVVVPRIALESVGPDGRPSWIRDSEPDVSHRLSVSRETLSLILESLEEVVMGLRGTARRSRVEGFRIGGKTGTAQNPHGEDHALYAAIAPMNDPRYVVVVVAEESGHGGAVAAPVAQPILQQLLTGSPEPKLAEWKAPEGSLP
jgi:penicillin-binding protein 2